MAALTGEPVDLSQPDDEEPAEDRDATQDRQIENLSKTAPFVAAPDAAPSSTIPQSPLNPRRNPTQPTRQFRPLPRAMRPPPNLTAISPLRSPIHQLPETPPEPLPRKPRTIRTRPREAHRALAPLNGAAMVAAALTGGLRRAEPPAPAAPAAVSNAAASNDARAPAPSLLDRLAVKSILDNLRRPEAKAPAPQSAPTPGATASASAAASAAPDATTPKAASPAGGLRDKLGVFTADRMQARRDAEQIKGASQAGTAVLASLEALERQETTGILNKIRDAANANGGIERVLSEMRPGGAFEDLRKEFNVALSHDEGFAAAYEKATGALSSYAETRAGMISAPRPRADINLARLETLDQEIGAAAKTLPGLKDGKNALDEALEGGKEAVEKAFTAIRQAFTRDADVRGPSPSPSFGP